jgi:hypothetical protein
MFGFNARRQVAGAVISARTINRPAAQAEKSARLRVGTGLAQFNLSGQPKISRIQEPEYVMRITAVGTGAQAGSYGWQAQYGDPDHPGVWLDLDAKLSGTLADDPMWEYNLNANLTVDMIVGPAMRVGREREMRFLYGRCG